MDILGTIWTLRASGRDADAILDVLECRAIEEADARDRWTDEREAAELERQQACLASYNETDAPF